MTTRQRGSQFRAGLDDHGLAKQHSGFVLQSSSAARPDFELVHERDRGAFAVRSRPPDLKGIVRCTTRLSF
jgi:hypothetical protein